MSDEVLSQEEVDALLRGVTGEDEEENQGQVAQGIPRYDIGRQERIVRGRMPTLEIINERFTRNLRIGLFNFLRRTAEISTSPIKVMKYSDFVRNLVVPTNLNLIQIKPFRGTGLMIFDPDLVFLIVDNLFGSDGRYHVRVEGRDFTPTEQRIIHRLLDVVFSECEKAWSQVYPIEFVYLRSEMNTQFANIASPTEIVVTMTFRIELGAGGGDFHICLPYSMIEPIRETLASPMPADRTAKDSRWSGLMQHQIQAAEIELVATLAHAEITLRQVIELKKGDIVMVDIPKEVTVSSEGVAVFEAGYGASKGCYALKIERLLVGVNEFEEQIESKE